MASYLYVEGNIVGAVVLFFLLTGRNKSRFCSQPADQWAFNGVLIVNLLIFLLNTLTFLVNGLSGPGWKAVNLAGTTLYYLLCPLISVLWISYTDLKIHESKSSLLKRLRFYAIPAAVCSAAVLASPVTGWLFVIDAENHYSRGPFFPVMTAVILIYPTVSFLMPLKDILQHGWAENKAVDFPLMLFPAAVIAAAVIQAVSPGISVLWTCTMLTCTNIYINMQNTELSTDHLTGLYNQRSLDRHLQKKLQAKRGESLLFALILDVDDFKKINDICGHLVGDGALTAVAGLLRQSLQKNEDFAARMGGDEFIIVGERSERGEINRLMETIRFNTDDYNGSRQSDYALSLSMGYSILQEGDTADSFLSAADMEMYRCKHRHKAAALPKDFTA